MNTLSVNIINETQKLFSKKKTAVLFVLTALITIFAAVLVSNFESRLGIIAVASSDFPIFVLNLFAGFFLPLFVCMVTADLFAGEMDERTLKISLLRPITRFKVYTAKLCTAGIYIIISLGFIFILSLILSFLLVGGNSVIMSLLKGLTAYAAAAVPMLLIAVATAFMAQFFKSSSGVLTFSIFIFIAMKIMAVIFPQYSQFLITSYVDWHLLWSGGKILTNQILNLFMFMVSYSIIFLATGFYMFDRKEL